MANATMDPRASFLAAQAQLLQHVGITADSRFLEIPAVTGRVHVLTSGRGSPVVFVPGLGDPAALWAPLLAELQGFSAYAVDRPSTGLSGSARHSTRTLRNLAVSFLEQVLDALGLDRATFVASSMGSLWTMWLALDRPHRVAAMAHVGCPALILGTSAPLPMRLLSVPVLGNLLMRLTPPSAKQVEKIAAMVGEDLTGFPQMRELLVAAHRLPGAGAAMRELLHAVLRWRGVRPKMALTAEQLAQIQQPVQLVWGDRDPFGSVQIGEQAAACMPHAQLHVVRGAGHIPWFAHAPEVASVVAKFLRSTVSEGERSRAPEHAHRD